VLCGGTQEILVQRTYSAMRDEGAVSVRTSSEGRAGLFVKHISIVIRF
jgi:hypothetical protein